jgi:hypothetical protein
VKEKRRRADEPSIGEKMLQQKGKWEAESCWKKRRGMSVFIRRSGPEVVVAKNSAMLGEFRSIYLDSSLNFRAFPHQISSRILPYDRNIANFSPIQALKNWEE